MPLKLPVLVENELRVKLGSRLSRIVILVIGRLPVFVTVIVYVIACPIVPVRGSTILFMISPVDRPVV